MATAASERYRPFRAGAEYLLATDGVPGPRGPGTTEGAEGLGLGPSAREEGNSPGKGYCLTSELRAEDEPK